MLKGFLKITSLCAVVALTLTACTGSPQANHGEVKMSDADTALQPKAIKQAPVARPDTMVKDGVAVDTPKTKK